MREHVVPGAPPPQPGALRLAHGDEHRGPRRIAGRSIDRAGAGEGLRRSLPPDGGTARGARRRAEGSEVGPRRPAQARQGRPQRVRAAPAQQAERSVTARLRPRRPARGGEGGVDARAAPADDDGDPRSAARAAPGHSRDRAGARGVGARVRRRAAQPRARREARRRRRQHGEPAASARYRGTGCACRQDVRPDRHVADALARGGDPPHRRARRQGVGIGEQEDVVRRGGRGGGQQVAEGGAAGHPDPRRVAVSREDRHRKLVAGNWKLGTGSWKLEAGSWKPDMRRFVTVLIALVAAVSFLAGVAVNGGLSSPPPVTAPASAAGHAVARASAHTSGGVPNFADVAERLNASVVNIDAASRGGRERRQADENGDPRDLGLPHQGSGSGFVIDKTGFILTNYHVIEDADRITVTLADGRALRGALVGADPAIDVALLRVTGTGPLPEAPLGNSDELRVGEWVCAIGNPLGYVHSVTVGVVSFIGRKLFDASLDDYIQTDAAINLGNSGGPLINARGEVIGINAAISSRANNIGFAVPINQAVAILPQLEAHGTVTRGFIGVTLIDVTAELQRSLKLSVGRGALVQDVRADSPAA